MLRSIAVLVALVAAASAYSDFKHKCPMVSGKNPFDLEKFQGDWYMVAGNDVAHEKNGKCAKMSFSYVKDDKKDGVSMINRYTGVSMKDNKPFALESFFTPMFTDKMANFYSVYRPEGTNIYTATYKQSIVATDYSSYAVLVACKTDFDSSTKTFGRTLIAGIWSRQGVTLSKDTIETLSNLLTSYDIEPSAIKHAHHQC